MKLLERLLNSVFDDASSDRSLDPLPPLAPHRHANRLPPDIERRVVGQFGSPTLDCLLGGEKFRPVPSGNERRTGSGTSSVNPAPSGRSYPAKLLTFMSRKLLYMRVNNLATFNYGQTLRAQEKGGVAVLRLQASVLA